jgi:hypothetical protein
MAAAIPGPLSASEGWRRIGVTVLRAASAEATATMAVTRLISDAFCDCVSCHQANPIPKASVDDTKAVTVPATATGCFLVCGHR